MNDKMRDVLGKVHADDQAKEKETQDDLERKAQEAEKDRQRLAAELGDEGMQDYISKLKSHDWFYAYSDDHRYYTKGSKEWKEISRLQKILDPKHEIYNKYAPDMMKSVKTEESVQEAHDGNDEKRYVVNLEMYMYDKDDESVIRQAQKLADALDAKYDNRCSVDTIVEQPFGTIGNRKVKEHTSVIDELNKMDESVTVTSASDVSTVVSPHLAIGDKKTRKKYGLTGGLPNPPKAKKVKPTDNALDMKGTSIFGGPLKRNM